MQDLRFSTECDVRDETSKLINATTLAFHCARAPISKNPASFRWDLFAVNLETNDRAWWWCLTEYEKKKFGELGREAKEGFVKITNFLLHETESLKGETFEKIIAELFSSYLPVSVASSANF